jgi:tRNA:m4X modification enzyme
MTHDSNYNTRAMSTIEIATVPSVDSNKHLEPKTKKVKLDDEMAPSQAVPAPVQCKFFVIRKKRLCKMTVKKGKNYCGEHEIMLNDADKAKNGSSVEVDESQKNRIPCPLDPKHTVYANKLDKHLKICNARPKEDLPKYIKIGINNQPSSGSESTVDYEKIKLSDINDECLLDIIGKIEQLYATHIEGNVELISYEHNYLKEELNDPIYGPKTKKHLLQTSALLEIMKKLEFIRPETAFIEYGAGKGQISFYLANIIKELPNSKVYLIGT